MVRLCVPDPYLGGDYITPGRVGVGGRPLFVGHWHKEMNECAFAHIV